MSHPMFSRPRTVAQARRRRTVVLTTLTVLGAVGIVVLTASRLPDGRHCDISVYPDGTWVAVNFDPTGGIPDDCVLRVWDDPNA